MGKLLVFGDVSLDQTFTLARIPAADEKVHSSAFLEGYGGVGANTAVAAARAGAHVRFAACIGTDAASGAVATHLRAEGVEPWLAVREGALCRVVSLVEPDGEKRLVLHPGVSLYPDPEQAEAVDLRAVAHVHTAIYGPAGRNLVARARAQGIGWSLDLEPATFPTGIENLSEEIDGAATVFVNDRAAATIGGDPVPALLALGAREIVRTRGAEGASLHDRTGCLAACRPAAHAPIRDTTGAGDCLAGWYLAARLRGCAPPDALGLAVEAARLACTRPGAHESFPRAGDLETTTKDKCRP